MRERDFALESTVFGLMLQFLHTLDMRDLWRPGVPQLKLRIYQFDRLLILKLPSLHAHFRDIGLSPDFFASQWFLTLLTYNLPHAELVRVWDLLLTDGWKTIFRVGIAILAGLESVIATSSLEEVSKFFRDNSRSFNARAARTQRGILSKALHVKVSTRVLIDLEGDYVGHVLRQQLSDHPDIHGTVAFVDKRVASIVRTEMEEMEAPLRKDVKVLREKIELAERGLNAAHEAFVNAAKEFQEIQADLEELRDAKEAISHQLHAMALVNMNQGTYKSVQATDDFAVFQSKIEHVDAEVHSSSKRFSTLLWRTAQAQVDLEETLERKRMYSEQLQAVLEQSEMLKAAKMKALYASLNST